MENPDKSQRIYFQNLDILRFIAAYMIVLLHCFFGWKTKFGNPDFITSTFSGSALDKLEINFHNFSFGVDIFFIISGFLITYLLLSENEKTGKVDILKFYIRRALRIWPLYFLMILTGPLLSYFFFEQSPGYLYQFFFLGNFDIISQGMKSVATSHLWSICIEEHFYLFCPLLVAFIPIKRLPQVLLGIIFISILFRAYLTTLHEYYGIIVYVHTLSRIDVLALGSLFGYLFYHKKLQFNDPLPVRLIIYFIFLFSFFNVDYNECGTVFTATMKKYFFVLMVAYWAGNFLFNPDAKFAARKPTIFHQFGKVSYGIYMFNPVIVFLVLQLFAKFSFQNYFLFLALVHVLIAVATAISYRFLELPFLALKEKYAVIKSGGEIKSASESLSDQSVSPAKELEAVPIKIEGGTEPH